MHKWIGSWLLILFANICLQAQADFRFFIPINVNIGASLANLERISGSNISQRPGVSLSLNTGMMMRYREFGGISLEGGFRAMGYNFSASGIDNLYTLSILHYDPNILLRPFILIPLKNNKHSVLRIDFTGGLHFVSTTDKKIINNGFEVDVLVQQTIAPYIAPEIGLSQLLGKRQMDLGITYMHHFTGNGTLNLDLKTTGGQARATTRLNFVGLVLRVQPEIMRMRHVKQKLPKEPKPEQLARERNKKLVVIRETPLMNDTLARETKALPARNRKTLEFNKASVMLEVWDNNVIDGDTISIYLNDTPVLLRYGLTAEKEKVELVLRPGENNLLIVAENEGTIRPNTAAFRFKSGRKKYRLVTITSLKQNELLKLNFKK